MSELFLYLFAVVVVLAFFGQRSKPVHAPAATQRVEPDEPEVFEDWIEEIVKAALFDPEESEIVQKLKARNQADIDELLAIPSSPQPVDWESLTPGQIRSYAQLYEIPVSKRGRISSTTISKLQEVA